MASIIQSNSVEDARIDAVVVLLGEAADQLSRQCHRIDDMRFASLNRSIGNTVSVLLVAILAVLLVDGPVSPGSPGGILLLSLVLGAMAIRAVPLISELRSEIASPLSRVFRQSLAEASYTYRNSRSVLAQASAIHEHNHLDEHQRLLLETRMGALDAAVAYYEAIVDPLVKKHLPESSLSPHS